jgi:uncharacterized protein YggE
MALGENNKTVYNQVTRNSETVRDGFIASTQIQFILADFSKYASIWMGIAGIDGVRVNSVYLENSDRIKYQNEARAKAVLAAKDKAKAIADTLGVNITRPLSIEEDISISEGYRRLLAETGSPVYGVASNNVSFENVSSSTIDQSVAPGSIPIRSRVKATFGLQGK